MGRDAIKRTTEQLLEAIKGSGAIYSNIADKLGVSWNTAKKLVEANPEALQAYSDEEEIFIDDAVF